MVSVDLNNKVGFLEGGPPKLLRLAILYDGKPRISSVWYLWSQNHFWISTSEDRLKVSAIRKNPQVSLIVDTDTMPYEGVIVEGVATLERLNVEAVTKQIVKKYVPKEDVEVELKSLMRAPRILIKIKPARSIDIMSYKEH